MGFFGLFWMTPAESSRVKQQSNFCWGLGPYCFLKMKTLKPDNKNKVVSIKMIFFALNVSVILGHCRLSAMLFQAFCCFVLFLKIKVFFRNLAARSTRGSVWFSWEDHCWEAVVTSKLQAQQPPPPQCLVPEIQTDGVVRCEDSVFLLGQGGALSWPPTWCGISHCLCNRTGKARVQGEVQIVQHSAHLKYHKAAGVMTLWEKLAEGDNKKHSSLS